MKRFEELVRFDNDDGAGDPPTTDVTTPQAGGPEKWTPEQQAEFNRRAADLKKAAQADGRKAALAEFEATKQAEKAAAEATRLAEEGQYKELAANADRAKADAEKRAAAAEAKAKTLELQMSFNCSVRKLNIEFADEKAETDAFEHLDLELDGDDGAGMDKAIEKLQKERAYYFGSLEPRPNTDARQNGRRQTNQKSEDEHLNELKQRIPSLGRRPG